MQSWSRWRSTWRIASPILVPPGSRTSQTPTPEMVMSSTKRRSWVDFPEPSGPSKTMNLPRRAGAQGTGASAPGALELGALPLGAGEVLPDGALPDGKGASPTAASVDERERHGT